MIHLSPISDERLVVVSQHDKYPLAYIVQDNRVGHIPCFDEYKSDQNHQIDMMSDGNLGQLALFDLYDDKNVKSMPEKFKAAILQYSSPSLDYNKIVKSSPSEFNNVFIYCLDQWDMLVTATSGEYLKCCCSHAIKVLNFYRNVFNDNVLMIGIDCIDKFTKNTKIHNDYKLYKNIFKNCAHCKKKTLVTEIIGHCCPNCQPFQQIKQSNKRPCSSCLKLSNKPKCNQCISANNPDIIFIKADLTSSDINNQVTSVLTNYKKQCTCCKKDFYSIHRDDCTQCLEKKRQDEHEKLMRKIKEDQKRLEEEEQRRLEEEQLQKYRQQELERQKEEQLKIQREETINNLLLGFDQNELEKLEEEIRQLQQTLETKRQISFIKTCLQCKSSFDTTDDTKILFCSSCYIKSLQVKCLDCPKSFNKHNLIQNRCTVCHSIWSNRKCIDCAKLLSQVQSHDNVRCIVCHRLSMYKECSGCSILFDPNLLNAGFCNPCFEMSLKQTCETCKMLYYKTFLVNGICKICISKPSQIPCINCSKFCDLGFYGDNLCNACHDLLTYGKCSSCDIRFLQKHINSGVCNSCFFNPPKQTCQTCKLLFNKKSLVDGICELCLSKSS